MQHVRNLGQMIRKTASHLVKETKGTQSAKLVKRYVYHNVFNKALYYFHLQIKVQKTELSTYNNVEEGSRTKQNKKQRRENLQCIQVWIKSLFPFFRYHKQSVWFSSLTHNGPSLSANCLYIHLFGTCTLPFKPKCSFYTAPKCARSLGSEWTKQIKVQEQKPKKKKRMKSEWSELRVRDKSTNNQQKKHDNVFQIIHNYWVLSGTLIGSPYSIFQWLRVERKTQNSQRLKHSNVCLLTELLDLRNWGL